MLNKNALHPNFYYNFIVTANCSGIIGNSNIKLYVEPSDLVVILDRTDSSIPSAVDVFINGNNSYDPDSMSIIEHLWTCEYTNGYSCNKILLFNNLTNLTIISSNLIPGAGLLITLTISADIRMTSKTILFDVIDSLYTYIGTSFNTAKVEPSFDTYIHTEITSTGSYSIT